MDAKSKYRLKITVLIVLVMAIVIPWAIYILKYFSISRRHLMHASDISYVHGVVSEVSNEFFQNEGKYQKDMIAIKDIICRRNYFGRNNRTLPMILDEIEYSSDGDGYDIFMDITFEGSIYSFKSKGHKGKTTFYELHLDGALLGELSSEK